MKIDYSRRIFGLDVMRAVAILLVLISHTSLLMFRGEVSMLLTIIKFFGAIGVDIFFVLSGFLIGGILLKQIQNGKTSGKDMLYFLVRRWLRTLPNYYLILIINIMLLYFLHDVSLKGIPAFFLFLQNFASGQMDFFTESWSLSIEEFAYVIGPLLLLVFFFLMKKTDKAKILLMVSLFIILLMTVFRLVFHLNEEVVDQAFWSQNLRKVVIYRIDSIYYGFVAAYIAMHFKNNWRKRRFLSMIIGSGLFLGMHLVIFKLNWLPDNSSFFYNLLYLPLVSISIAFFLPFLDSWRETKFLRSPVTWISLLSYSLYLVNYSILLLPIEKYMDVVSMSLLGKCIMAVLFWVVSFMLSYALFRWYEKPFMNLRDKPFILNKFKQ